MSNTPPTPKKSLGKKEKVKWEIFVSIIASLIYNEVINNDTSRIEKSIKDHLLKDKKNIDMESVKQESLFLLTFLSSYCFQRKFAHYGNERIKEILDELHRLIGTKLNNIQEKDLNIRYKQYYKAIRADADDIYKKIDNMILFYSLSLAFVGNLIGRELSLKEQQTEFLSTRLNVGILISVITEELCTAFDYTLKQLEDYQVIL